MPVELNRDSIEIDCLCRICPSFVECGERIGFCVAGSASVCIDIEAGCLCLGCPVWVKQCFRHVYYCVRGAEPAQ
ncbi:MAG: DUF2769 domain-containing protein [Dehalogenimonas sp.]|uniref:DUF2769 domain-containing protein n=1 Tax=Candidatus Dehalogenimonas loeffleri TaxID=3127115 RepID=A0ABZ2J7V7_9CHLR|nr:DUF2769 domain-containing protein [Dehalogenimonas sp.]